MLNCSCEKGFPTISALRPHEAGFFLASHRCSECGNHLFEIRLAPGEKVIATANIPSEDGRMVIPKGRIVRITGFMELPSLTAGFAFCGMLAAGAFSPEGFAAVWDVEKIFDLDGA